MKKLFSFLFCAVVFFPVVLEAKGMVGINRGGMGFIFPDNNSFVNPGQFAMGHAFAIEGSYGKMDGGPQGAEASVVYGNGKFGLGAFGARMGDKLNTPDLDVDRAGVGMGLALAKDRLTLGAGYDRVISTAPSDSGTLSTALTLNPTGKGFAFALRATTNIKPIVGRSTQTGTLAVGYEFRPGASMEAYGTIQDFANAKDDVAGLALNLAGQYFYASALGQYNRLASNYTAAGRFGFVFGPIDFSVMGGKVLQTGSSWTYGGTLRAAF